MRSHPSRPRLRALVAALAAVLVATILPAVGSAPAAEASSGWSVAQLERYAFCRVNQERAAHGLPALQLDAQVVSPGSTHLSATARAWSAQRTSNGGHPAHAAADRTRAELDAVDPRWTAWSENTGELLPNRHPGATIEAFMASPGHRANMLGSYNRVGLGVAKRSDGGAYVTIRFLRSPNDMPAPRDVGASGCSSFPTGTLDGSRLFEDVPPSSYYGSPVAWLVGRGVTTGCLTGRFCPHQGASRAQVLTFLHRMAGEPAARGSHFADVPAGNFASNATRWGRHVGLTTGVDGTNRFEPHRSTTRAELVTLLHRFSGSPAAGAPRSVDVPRRAYYADAVAWAERHGITTGVGGSNRFEPNRAVTRAEVATFLVRLAQHRSAAGPGAVPIRV